MVTTMSVRQPLVKDRCTLSLPISKSSLSAQDTWRFSKTSKGVTPIESGKHEQAGENLWFSTNKSPYLKKNPCEITPRLLSIYNMKSHMPFPLLPKSTTFDDLQRPNRSLLHKWCVFRSSSRKFEKKTGMAATRGNCNVLKSSMGHNE